ncbi:auxilin-like clathrin-binding protein required for normal clathrin function [Saitoella coloradoensis]
MNDFGGLDWSITSSSSSSNQRPGSSNGNLGVPTSNGAQGQYSLPPHLRSLNESAQGSSTVSATGSRTSTPAPAKTDSFASLVSFGKNGTVNSANMTMEQRRKQLEAEKAAEEVERRKKAEQHYGDNSFWDNLSGSTTPAPVAVPAKPAASTVRAVNTSRNDDEDLFAAFSSDAPVNMDSHLRPVSSHTTASSTKSPAPALDPFDTSSLMSPISSSTAAQRQTPGDDDDILGLLGKPVQPKASASEVASPPPTQPRRPVKTEDDPKDAAVAMIVDMGFSAEQAQIALAATKGGLDVQAAVEILVNSRGSTPVPQQPQQPPRRAPIQQKPSNESLRSTFSARSQRSMDSTAAAQANQVATNLHDLASTVSSSLFTSANSLWKTSRTRIHRTLAELTSEPEASDVPKWMRDQDIRERVEKSKGKIRESYEITEEAKMLDMENPRKSRRNSRSSAMSVESASSGKIGADPVIGITSRWAGGSVPPSPLSPTAPSVPPPTGKGKGKMPSSAFTDDPETYVSPARRRGAPPSMASSALSSAKSSPGTSAFTSPTMDMFGEGSSSGGAVGASGSGSGSRPREIPRSMPPPTAVPSRPKSAATSSAPQPQARPRPTASTRPDVPISATDMATVTKMREEGSEAFKRGDYSAALAAYTSALTPLPPSSTLRIPILTNRSLTRLKLGDPRSSLSDCSSALTLIGPTRGEGEQIEGKEMKEFWGKAMVRKAQGLEQVEKWREAVGVWEECVGMGVGGGVALEGKRRCEGVLNPKPMSRVSTPKPAAVVDAKGKLKARASVADDLGFIGGSGSGAGAGEEPSGEAVERLRKANAAAEAESNERLALHDSVNAKLDAWQSGKEQNLRALLASMDDVLWPEAGWKKIGMAELVMPNKVKTVYMKAIGKVHPDKISKDATVEQKMIAGSVFNRLNTAWDVFKSQNGM